MTSRTLHWPWHATLAALIICVAGLKMASDLIEPFLLALFLSIVCFPGVSALRSRGVPEVAAVLLVVFGVVIALLLGAVGVGASVNSFVQSLPEYQSALAERTGSIIDLMQNLGMSINAAELKEQINAGAVMKFIANLLGRFGSVLGNFLLVMLTVSFILLEAARFPAKLQVALGNADDRLHAFTHFSDGLQKYLAIKSLVSLATGVLVTVLLYIFEVDYPLLWGSLAFLFNYIPNIGSFLAAIPACMLAWILHGTGTLLSVGAGFIAINMLMGNVVEPRFMGRSLGLSTLVVFISMVFWGWVLGPVGMILSVPLTMIVRIALENTHSGKWIAVLLGPEVPEAGELVTGCQEQDDAVSDDLQRVDDTNTDSGQAGSPPSRSE